MRRRDLLCALAGGASLLAGCGASRVGAPPTTEEPNPTPTGGDTPTPVEDGTPTPEDATPTTGTPTTPESRTSPGSPDSDPTATPIDPYEAFPEGPKEPPERPDSLTLDTARAFARTFEYRFVYNTMWFGENTEVTVDCEVERAESIETGYEVAVSCRGYSNTGGEPRPTGTGTTTVVHGDYFTRTFVYVVTGEGVTRREVTG